MDEKIMWIIIGAVALMAIIAIIIFLVKFFKLPKEERKEIIISFIMGLVVQAEEVLGAGKGSEKLAQVEAEFKKKAPWFLKIVLTFTGAGTLQELIEVALVRVKDTFGKEKK